MSGLEQGLKQFLFNGELAPPYKDFPWKLQTQLPSPPYPAIPVNISMLPATLVLVEADSARLYAESIYVPASRLKQDEYQSWQSVFSLSVAELIQSIRVDYLAEALAERSLIESDKIAPNHPQKPALGNLNKKNEALSAESVLSPMHTVKGEFEPIYQLAIANDSSSALVEEVLNLLPPPRKLVRLGELPSQDWPEQWQPSQLLGDWLKNLDPNLEWGLRLQIMLDQFKQEVCTKCSTICDNFSWIATASPDMKGMMSQEAFLQGFKNCEANFSPYEDLVVWAALLTDHAVSNKNGRMATVRRWFQLPWEQHTGENRKIR